jgi:hypothetical protein
MRRLLSIAAIGALALTAFVLVQCNQITGGAPTAFKLEPTGDSASVKLSWTAPSEGTPDKYVISFAEGTGSYSVLKETTATSYVHDPSGKTGKYKVEAKFGSSTYAATDEPTTVPVATDAKTVAELNASGNSGYGWTRADGKGTTYSMTQSGDVPKVDFYITDTMPQSSPSNAYLIASGDVAPYDPGDPGVPTSGWRQNGFTDALSSEAGPLPVHSDLTYFNWSAIPQYPTVVGCYTQDGYYAMVKIASQNTGDHTVQAQSWFQLVKGLRLIKH